jgi:predicted Zn finger-like uncharacterized protein
MQVKCPKCGYMGNIVDKLVPEEGRTVKCPKCRNSFLISRPKSSLREGPVSEDTSTIPKTSDDQSLGFVVIQTPSGKLDATYIQPRKSEELQSGEKQQPKTSGKSSWFIAIIVLLSIAVLLVVIYFVNTTFAPTKNSIPLSPEEKRVAETKAILESSAEEFFKENGFLVNARVFSQLDAGYSDFTMQITYISEISDGRAHKSFENINDIFITALVIGKTFHHFETIYPDGHTEYCCKEFE